MMAFFIKNRKVKIALLVVSALVLLTGAAVLGYVALANRNSGASNAAKLVAAPNLVGLDITKAREAAHEAGLKIDIDRWADDKSAPTNQIVSQNPKPDEKVKADGVINVIVNCCSPGAQSSNPDPIADPVKKEDLKPLPNPPIQPGNNKLGQIQPNLNPLKGKVVVIDPGHQQRADLEKEPVGPGSSTLKLKVTGGATGVKSRTPEYVITLQISQKLKEKLTSRGIKVVMTRETSAVRISNIERARMANEAKADLFIRIHNDGNTDPNKSGISTLYPAQNQWTGPIYKNSLAAAQVIQKELVEATKHADGGIVARSDITGFNWSKVPVILVEAGFLSNPAEDKLLNTPAYQDTLAEAMAQGIIEYLSGK